MSNSIGKDIANAIMRISAPIDMQSPKSIGEEIASMAFADYVQEESVQVGIEQESVVIVDPKTSQVLYKRPSAEAYMQMVGATKSDHRFKRRVFDENLHSARQYITFSLIAASLGFLIVLGGVVAMIFGHSQAGIVTSAAGIVSELVAVLFFNQAKHFVQRLDHTLDRLLEIEGYFRAFAIAEQVPNQEFRAHLLEAIVMKMVGIESDKPQTTDYRQDASSEN
jgi:hypothetical protein